MFNKVPYASIDAEAENAPFRKKRMMVNPFKGKKKNLANGDCLVTSDRMNITEDCTHNKPMAYLVVEPQPCDRLHRLKHYVQ
jgi:hypothetical protein